MRWSSDLPIAVRNCSRSAANPGRVARETEVADAGSPSPRREPGPAAAEAGLGGGHLYSNASAGHVSVLVSTPPKPGDARTVTGAGGTGTWTGTGTQQIVARAAPLHRSEVANATGYEAGYTATRSRNRIPTHHVTSPEGHQDADDPLKGGGPVSRETGPPRIAWRYRS